MLRTRLSLVTTAVFALVVSTLSVLALSAPAHADPTPLGLHAGDLVIADTGHNRVIVREADGSTRVLLDTGLDQPADVVVTPGGDVVIADANDDEIVKLPADGSAPVVLNQNRYAFGVSTLALDGHGYVLFGGTSWGGIGRVPLAGGNAILYTDDSRNYSGLAVTSDDHIISADCCNGHVWRMNYDRTNQTLVPEMSDPSSPVPPAFGTAPFNIMGLTLTPDDRIVETDQWSSVVWEQDGAGGAVSYGTDLDHPSDVALGTDGTAYVADTQNDRVVSISPDRSSQSVVLDNTVLSRPGGVAVVPIPPAQVGDVFVATYGGDVVRMSPDGSDPVTVASGLGELTDVVVDDQGNAFASNIDGAVYEVPADGTAAILRFDRARIVYALAVGPDDSLTFTEAPGGVRRWTQAGGVEDVATDGGIPLVSVAVDADGVVYAGTGGVVRRVVSGVLENLPPDFADARGMTWDPTGRRVLIAHTGNDQLVELPDAAPEDVASLASVAGIMDVSVAGDGHVLAISADGNIAQLDADGSNLTVLTAVPGVQGIDTYSPRPSFTAGGAVPDTGNVGTAYAGYTFAAAANGGGTPTYSVYSGALPDGLSLNPATGALSGTPTASGTYDFRVLAVNKARGVVTDEQEIVVGKRLQTIAFTSSAPTSATARRVDATYTPTAAGGGSSSPIVISIDPAASAFCSYDSGTGKVTFLTIGSCVIHADRAGDTDYEDAPQVTQTITVAGLVQTNPSFSDTSPSPVRVGDTYTPAVTATGPDTPAEVVNNSFGGFPTFETPCTGTTTVTFVHVGTCRLQAFRPASERYSSASSSTRMIIINPGTLVFDPDAPEEVHVGDTYLPTSNAAGAYYDIDYGLTDWNDDGTQPACQVDYDFSTDQYAAHFNFPGTCVLTVFPTYADDWTTPSESTTITVLKAGQTITFDDGPTDPVVGDSYTPSADGGASANDVTFSIPDTDDVCTIDGADLVSFNHAGSCVVQADQEGDDSHEAGAATQTIVVGKAPQTIDFPTTGPSVEVGDTYTPSATAGSGEDVTFTLVQDADQSCQTLSDGVFSVQHVGTCKVRATQPGNDDYLAADPVDQEFTVTQGTPTVAFTSTPSTPRVGDRYEVTAETNADSLPSFAVDASAVDVCELLPDDRTLLLKRVGTCRVNVEVGGGRDWAVVSDHQSFTVGKGPQTITFTSTAPSPTVGSTYTPTATAGSGGPVTFGIASGSASVCSIAGGTVTFNSVGTCVVEADQVGTDDYLAAPTGRQSIGVGQLGQAVTFVSTAPLAALPGDTYAVVATATSGGPVDISVTPASVCSVTGSTVQLDHAGACVVTAEQAGSAVWSPASASQTVTVGKRGTALELDVRPTELVATLTVGSGTPGGDVEFTVDGQTVGSAPLAAQDGALVATLDHARPIGGSHVIVARFLGSGDFGAAEDSFAWTDPEITAALSSTLPASELGWYRTPVTVTFTCTVGTAPLVAPCPAPVLLTQDRYAWQYLIRSIAAEDGGSAKLVLDGIQIDGTAPWVKVKGVRNGRTYSSRRELHCVAGDDMSGIDRCVVKTKRKAHGHKVVYRGIAWDNAGNKTVVRGRYFLR